MNCTPFVRQYVILNSEWGHFIMLALFVSPCKMPKPKLRGKF